VVGDGGVVLAATVKRCREIQRGRTCPPIRAPALMHITVQACRGVERPDESGLGMSLA
jgi:hypothetical protein